MLEAVASGREQGAISSHSLAETYSALTSVPLVPRILPSQARQIVSANILPHFTSMTITGGMYERGIEACAARGLGGGKVYDALLLECARASKPDRIYTFNLKDFRKLAPDLADRIAAP